MLSEYANEYRDLARQCLAFAAASHSEAKAAWLELASKWRRLAEETEKNGGYQPESDAARRAN